jgi:phage I-like protein
VQDVPVTVSLLPPAPLWSLSSGARAVSGADLPSRIRILQWGVNQTTKGPFILDDEAARQLVANQAGSGFERVALDYEHNTYPGSEEYQRTSEPRPVAAHGTVKIIPGDGLYLEQLAWTPSGQAHARNYEDVSGTLRRDAQGRVTFVHSVALTRNGATPGAHLLSATELPTLTTPVPSQQMNRTEILALLAGLVGLSNTATETELQAVLRRPATPAAGSAPPELAALTARLEKLEGRPAPDNATLTTLSTRVADLEQSATAARTAADQAERDRLVAAASSAGKVIPLSADALKTVPTPALRELIDGLKPGTVTLTAGQRPTTAAPELKGRARVAAAFNKQLAGQPALT